MENNHLAKQIYSGRKGGESKIPTSQPWNSQGVAEQLEECEPTTSISTTSPALLDELQG